MATLSKDTRHNEIDSLHEHVEYNMMYVFELEKKGGLEKSSHHPLKCYYFTEE